MIPHLITSKHTIIMQTRLALASVLLTYQNPQILSVFASIIALVVALDSLRMKIVLAGGLKLFFKNFFKGWKL